MKKDTTRTVPHRRRREGKTNYNRRIKLLSSNMPRLIIRRRLNSFVVQLVTFDIKGDKVLASFDSKSLKKMGWKFHTGNIPSAYLAGYVLGKKAQKAGITEAILDLGSQRPQKGSSLYSALKGAVDSGLNIPHSDSVLPDEDRINGVHITRYESEKRKDSSVQFSDYKKRGADPANIARSIEEIKGKV